MKTDQHAESRDRKRTKARKFVSDNRRSVRWLGKKLNKPVRGGVREWAPTEEDEKDTSYFRGRDE